MITSKEARISGDWLSAGETQSVLAMLETGGAQALLVGGCVRNSLLGVPVGDMDISTDARPDAVMDMAAQAGLRVVPTGIDHGTVTVISDGIPFEITTFRRDVETDGRRAVVHFADTMEQDAARRDFTMNALYARRDGVVVDPLGGMADLRARRVRFIGDATARIREDYLRSLRFFRFHALYGDPEGGFDPQALDGIGRTLDGLDQLSRERVGAEMIKLLGAPDPAPSVAVMRQVGVLMRCLPGADDTALAPLVALEQGADVIASALRRLAVIGGETPVQALRLSRAQGKKLAILRDGMGHAQGPAEIAYRHGADVARDIVLLRCASFGTPLPAGYQDRIAIGAGAQFPVQAADLMPEHTGPALGARMDALEQAWIASDFTLDRSALMAL